MDWKLELVAVPVSDVDRAKRFYTDQVGFNADHDHQVNDDLRFVQLTPPGSACSIALGTGLTDAEPGSVTGLQMVVSDIDAARAQLLDGGVEVSDVQDFAWGRFVFFADPDGNRWAVQERPAVILERGPVGRVQLRRLAGEQAVRPGVRQERRLVAEAGPAVVELG